MRPLIVVLIALLLVAFDAVRPGSAAEGPDGKAIFAAKCSTCHQVNGQGGGPYPPLAGNPDLTAADTSGIIGTVVNGRSGPLTVLGHTYSGAMPVWRGTLTNAEIAAVLTYVRSAFGNAAPAISEDQVAAIAAPQAQSGAALYAAKCATCHQPGGTGTATYPPLVANDVVTADDPKPMIGIIVMGKSGPLTVAGKTYNGKMPTWNGQLSNADIAAVASYVRSAWGNKAAPVTEQEVTSTGTAVLAAVGSSIYAKRCIACHAVNGKGGGGGQFPALAGNADVNAGDPTKILTTILHGKNVMPSWKGQLSPGEISAVATYVRTAWGNHAGAVNEAAVAAIK